MLVDVLVNCVTNYRRHAFAKKVGKRLESR